MDDSDETLAYIQSLNRTKRRPKFINLNPICPYCGEATKLVNGTVIYPHRYDLKDKKFYLCADCNAYCECHGYTAKPLGMPANAELRTARIKAHNDFDALWKEENYIPRSATPTTKGLRMTRAAAYHSLSTDMHLPIKQTHIGQFDLGQCQQVLNFVTKYYAEYKKPD